MAYIPTQQQLEGKQAPASGITTKFDSDDRIVPESKRPDGTLRKERKIRPGFTPPEDVSRFRTARQQEADSRKPPPGMVIGMAAKPQQSTSSVSSSASSATKKNAKRKEKRHQAAAASKVEDAPDDWEAEDEPATTATSSVVNGTSTLADTNAADADKRAKALTKKLRQAEALKQRADKGEKLLPEQEDKINTIASLQAEISSLSLAPKSTSNSVKAILDDTDPARPETPNTGASPSALLQEGIAETSHPTDKGEGKKVPPQPSESEAHAKTRASGRPSTKNVPAVAA